MKNFIAKKYSDIKPSSMMRMAALAAGIKNSIDLTLGEPDISTPPEICEALCDAAKAGHTHYATGMGLAGLRSAISEYWTRKYGLTYTAENVFVTTGGSHASLLSMMACLDPGDEVIILEPFFTFYEQHILQAGGVPVFCMSGAESGFIPDPEKIERKITSRTKAIIVNSPCNPTGAVFQTETLEGIAKLAVKYNLIVVSDELYESFVYSGSHIPFASLPGMKDRTITIGGLSKSYAMTGWRIGYAISDASILNAMQVIGVVHTISVNTMVQMASEFAIRNCDTRINEIVALFRKRAMSAAEIFGSLPGIRTAVPHGSFYLFLDVSGTNMDGEQFAVKMLKEAGVVLIPGNSFGPHCHSYVRIACTVSEARMQEAADRMKKILQ